MSEWKGTWKPDGTGGWHTKSDIVEQYNSARSTPAPAQMLKDAIDEVVRLRERLAEADEANRRVSDENEKLRHELITSSDAAKYYDYGYSCARDMQKDEITRLRAENEKLREALRPFADRYAYTQKYCPDKGHMPIDIDDFRAAAAALKDAE